MNIYLDIDGVILINEANAAPHADQFLQYILSKYPETTYWLTTHCWKRENRAAKLVTPYLQPETVAMLDRIKPTEWGEEKTDAIDFSQPFLWFDDDLYPEERAILEKHNAVGSWVEINLLKNPHQLKDYLALK